MVIDLKEIQIIGRMDDLGGGFESTNRVYGIGGGVTDNHNHIVRWQSRTEDTVDREGR